MLTSISLQELYEQFDSYKETTFSNKRFKHKDILPLINQLSAHSQFTIKTIGKSLEERDIFLIKLGEGKNKVLLWSQMHGDEPTATMALFDICNFFVIKDSFQEIKKKILSEVTLYIIPMLNPDGTEIINRRNAAGIDLNRDASRLQSPESILLKLFAEKIKPDYGFNLHDQDFRWSVGGGKEPAVISFLSPPFNELREINNDRKKSMQLISIMTTALNKYIPGKIARYSDEFEPRSFGDTITQMNCSTILIESGRWNYDPHKFYPRKLNVIAILSAIKSIADNDFHHINIEHYQQIPENGKFLFDIVLRNLSLNMNGKKMTVDIAVNREEAVFHNKKGFYQKGTIEDIADLTTIFGYEDIDCSGMDIVPGKIYSDMEITTKSLHNLNSKELHNKGYTTVRLDEYDNQFTFSPFAFNLIIGRNNFQHDLFPSSYANFTIQKEGKVIYTVINGFLIDHNKELPPHINGLIL